MTVKELAAIAVSVAVFAMWSAAVLIGVPMAFEALQLAVPLPFTITDPIPLLVSGSLVFTGWIVFTRWWARTSGWQRLAHRYPAVEPRSGERIVVRYPYLRARYERVLLKAGESHAHFQLGSLFGRPPFCIAIRHLPFSVPWSDITAHSDPGGVAKGRVRFNVAGTPDVPFNVRVSDARRIIDASRGRVHLSK